MPQLATLPNEVVHHILMLYKWLRGMAIPLLFQHLKKRNSDEVALHDSLVAIALNPAILTSIESLDVNVFSSVAHEHEVVRLKAYTTRNIHLLVYALSNIPNLTYLRINLQGRRGERLFSMQKLFQKVVERVRLPNLKALIYSTPIVAPTGIPAMSPGLKVLSIQLERGPKETLGMIGLAGQLDLRAVELFKLDWTPEDVYEVAEILPSIRHLILTGWLEQGTTMADLVDALQKFPNLEDFYLSEGVPWRTFGSIDYRELLGHFADDHKLTKASRTARVLFRSCPNLKTASFPTKKNHTRVNTHHIVDKEGSIVQILDASYRPAINEFPSE